MAAFVGTNGNDTLIGTAGGDSFDGRGGNDNMQGLGGNDYFIMSFGGTSSYGTDVIDGGAGTDTIDFGPWAQSALIINLAAGTLSGGGVGGAGGGTIAGIERVVGGGFADEITGSAAAEVLSARGGNDTVSGGGGNDQLLGEWGDDWLDGGAGNDILTGGQNADSFVFTVAPGAANADTITDFTTALDTIRLDAAVMTQLSAGGNFVANSSGTAQQATDRVVYNTANGQLWYDADGTGVGAAQLIATLQGAPTLVATDIAVFGAPPAGNTINGTEGNDELVGTPESDTINGFGGSDTINGKGGNDTLSGGTQADRFVLDQAPGTAHADLVTDFQMHTDDLVLDLAAMPALGSPGPFASGDERFHSAPGATGGADAEDRVIYNASTGQVFYDADGNGSSAALLIGTIQGATGLAATDIVVVGDTPGSTITGTEGDDFLNGTEGDDFIDARGGNDTVSGLGGDDTILGGAGSDTFWFNSASGDYGHDEIDGGSGVEDVLMVGVQSAAIVDFAAGTLSGGGVGGTGSATFVSIETASGGAFADEFYADADGSTAYGGEGNDLFVGGAGEDLFSDDETRDNFDNVGVGDDQIIAGGGDDFIRINRGDDTVDAGAGNDLITIDIGFYFSGPNYTYGDDTIDGGIGTDRLTMIPVSAVTVDLGAGTMTGGGVGGDGSAVLTSIENFDARELDDLAHSITGSAGANILATRTGDTTLNGAGGNDTLTGGAGVNRFVFDQAPGAAHADAITDFETGSDDLVLDLAAMPALGAPGPFASGDDRFHAAGGATGGADAEDRVIYNSATGQVFYDADGNGGGAALLIVTLQGAPGLTATDIVVTGEAGDGGQHIVGTSGDDNLTGGDGDDLIEGLGGNDLLSGELGEDTLRGGDGNDTLNGREFQLGDSAADVLDGGLGDDAYHVFDENDTILADPGGIDTVYVSRSSWTLGAGLDNLVMEEHPSGGPGPGVGNELDNVMVWGSMEWGSLSGLGGNDTLRGLATLRGGDGDDLLDGGRELFGDAGNDLLIPGSPPDSFSTVAMTGGSGADTFLGGSGISLILDFASGVDAIRLDATNRPALGASGDFAAGDARFAANDSGAAQDASDRVIYNTSTGELWYDGDGSGGGARQQVTVLRDAPALTATDIEVVNGTDPRPTITGTNGNDTIFGTNEDETIDALGGNDGIDGRGGSDTLLGGAGNDYIVMSFGGTSTYGTNEVIDGGAGTDTIDFGSSAQSSLAINLAAGTLSGGGVGGAGGGTISGIERVIAGFHADQVTGSAAAEVIFGRGSDDTLLGGGGNDQLTGEWGNDWLSGGAGNDSLTGSQNNDSFVFDVAPGAANADAITDFTTAADKIRLDDAVHAGIGALGNFAAGDDRFHAAAGAAGGADAEDRVVYNVSTGQLYYDTDGSNAGAAQLIATLQGAPTLTASDIAVI